VTLPPGGDLASLLETRHRALPVALAGVLRARTVAEGVETAAQAFFLHAAGIDYGQGWFWSKALPPEELPRAIERGFGDRQRELLALLHAGKGR